MKALLPEGKITPHMHVITIPIIHDKKNDCKRISITEGITYKSPHCTRRTTASRLSTEGMPLDKIRDILGQVDERTTLSYIYNPNTEQENLDIMNKALNSSNKKNKKN